MEQITCIGPEADAEDNRVVDSLEMEEGAGSLEPGEGLVVVAVPGGSLEQQEGVGAQMVVHIPEEEDIHQQRPE